MAETATDLVVLLVDGAHAGKSRRLTMTWDGGGSWIRHVADHDVAAADRDPFASTDATLATDVVDFCRVVADRCDPGSELHALRLGAETLLDELLRVAPSLADFGAGPLARNRTSCDAAIGTALATPGRICATSTVRSWRST